MIIRKARDYQERDINRIEASWNAGANVPFYVLPTGGGKTFVMAELARRGQVPTTVIAHRRELVGQISMAFCGAQLPHKIIAPDKVVKRIIQDQVTEYGRSFYDPRSTNAVAGVDTLIRMDRNRDPLFKQTQLVMQDEGHHVLKANKWGTAFSMFEQARGLLVSATPERADGKGLGVHASGIADDMIVGPTMQELIDLGYLTPFRIIGIPQRIARGDLKVGASGDFTLDSMRKAFSQSKIIGDIPRHYLKYAAGKRGLTFVPDVEDAHAVAKAYRDAGVPAVALSSNTPDEERAAAIKDLSAGRILQIVNVDLIGEGFDCPAVEVVSFARWTESYAIYAQQFGRALRILEGKTHAIIIDHVGNVIRHNGPPTQARIWTLDGRTGKAGSGGAIPLRYCTNVDCAAPYERFLIACPYCGTIPEPPEHKTLETVDGDLMELDPETLDELGRAARDIDQSPEDKRRELIAKGVPSRFTRGAVDAHHKRQESQRTLRDAMRLWGGSIQASRGVNRREAQRLFFLKFGIDVLSAAGLDYEQAEALTIRVMGDLC